MKSPFLYSIIMLIFHLLITLLSVLALSNNVEMFVLYSDPPHPPFFSTVLNSFYVFWRSACIIIVSDLLDCLNLFVIAGTSACPAGRFYCRNLGSTPQFIFSSHVNDHFCGKYIFNSLCTLILSFTSWLKGLGWPEMCVSTSITSTRNGMQDVPWMKSDKYKFEKGGWFIFLLQSSQFQVE